jgi:hypothetical protein
MKLVLEDVALCYQQILCLIIRYFLLEEEIYVDYEKQTNHETPSRYKDNITAAPKNAFSSSHKLMEIIG